MLNFARQTSGFWDEDACHWFHSFYTPHMPRERREQQGGREGGSTEGIPMGLSLLVCTKCLHRQLQTQVCDVGQTCCWTSNHPKSPLDLHFNKTEWTLCFSRTWDFLSFPCLKITIQRFLEAMIRPVWDVGVVLDRHLDFKGQGVVKSTTLHFFPVLHQALLSSDICAST